MAVSDYWLWSINEAEVQRVKLKTLVELKDIASTNVDTGQPRAQSGQEGCRKHLEEGGGLHQNGLWPNLNLNLANLTSSEWI